ncbi:MAG: hypothetical protein LKG50_03690 [Prevotella sp.]|jgi:hypothetical protein|nr:hypothetical protein [Prevotella sp.]MCH4016859.1 hypothetical protein [Prevotella sp.]MCI1291459.1 hypothetical protein [Prevotella sp.]MCI1323739.1 hypothetical protein [Prevotella sp.]MCI1348948.1 hypothetical protein [Prevotella sp.]MCI1450033.1 hypothetical protein [Prevotella sp.]
MKKLIFSIAALAAIVVMGSCSNDSDLTSTTSSSSKVDSVTVSLNLNSGIEVSESSSSKTKSSANVPVTRAGSTDTNNNFVPDYSTGGTTGAFTAYFVAAETKGGYTRGNIVEVKTGLNGSTDTGGATNTVKVPDIKYNIYVTNYDKDLTPNETASSRVGKTFSTYCDSVLITTGESLDAENKANTVTISLPKFLYTTTPASQTLYLFGESKRNQFSTATNNSVTVELYSPYAAVAVSKSNSNVTNVYYGDYSSDQSNIASALTYGSTGTEQTDWFYEYILASDGTKSYTTNSTLKYGTTPSYIAFKQNITAGYIYQFTVNNSGTLTIKVNPFSKTNEDPIEIDPTSK